MEIGFHPSARAELDASVDFYESRLEGLGIRFLAAVEETTERIAASPNPGSPSQRPLGCLDEAVMRQVLAAPEQRETLRPGRDVLQSLLTIEGRCYLIRVFVDVDRTPAEVVTVYRTSKVQKYGRSVP